VAAALAVAGAQQEYGYQGQLPRNAQNGKRLRGLEGERIVPVPPLAIPRVKCTQVVRGVLGTT